VNPEQFPEIQEYYNFRCTLCGNCCTGSQQVHLNPFDLYKMARFLTFDSTQNLFSTGLVMLIKTERGVWLPRIRFKRKPFRFCPFLINEETRGLCKLHPDHKPLICSMAPVSRVMDFKQNTETWHLAPPVDDCPGMLSDKPNRLTQFKMDYETELLWQKRFFAILDQVQYKHWSQETFRTRLYVLDTTKPFEGQFVAMERAIR
jgi:Fe-S-cluster containining protein